MTSTLYYEAGFETNASALKMTCTVATHAATIGTGTWAHQSMAAVMGTGNYTAFAAQVKTVLDAAASSTFTVTYSSTTHLYTISRATTFTLDFSGGTTDTRLAHALGFTATSHSGANTYTSDVRPYYVMVPTELARSASLPFVYEPNDIVMEAVSDGGSTYAVAKNTTELWADWTQTMEAKAACFDLYAASSAPWTWQAFYKHVRGKHPVAVYESALYNAVYRLRADSAFFKATPVTSDWDAIYNLKFTTRYLGDLGAVAAPSAPTISGTVLAGNALTIVSGGGTVTSYTLYRSGVSAGTVSSGYTFVAADVGTITVRAVGPGGTSSDSNSLYSQDLSAAGTFARASAAYYYLSAPTTGASAFLASASSGTRRSADTRGDGIGASLLMEKAATNYLTYSRANNSAPGAGTAAITADANGGTDASGVADRINAASGQFANYWLATGPAGRVTGSVWSRAVSGTSTHQWYVFSASGAGAFTAHASISTTYGRREAQGTATASSGLLPASGQDMTSFGGIAAHAEDVYIDMSQLEAGYYPTSPIDTTSASATRAADTLSYATGAYPVGFLTSGVAMVVALDASSAEIVSGTEDMRLVQVGATDYVRIRATAGVCKVELVCGGSVVTSTTVTFSRAQALTITAKPSAGSLTVAGATTGNGTTTGSGAAWASSATLYVGGDNSGANNITGRIVAAQIAQAA